MSFQPKADPGIGREEDPIGSVGWAQRVRLRLQALVSDVDTKPDSLRRYVAIVQEHRAWTLMNKPDGSFFATWEEFCEHRQPWGLGRPWAELRPFVEAVSGKRAVALATVAPARQGERTDRRETSGPEVPKSDARERHEKRLRAIAERAPEPVRELYRADLIGAKEAAALGPKSPTPEEAARVTEIAIEVKRVAASLPASTPSEKRAAKRKIGETVREALGRVEDPVRAAILALEKVPFERRLEVVDAVEIPVDDDEIEGDDEEYDGTVAEVLPDLVFPSRWGDAELTAAVVGLTHTCRGFVAEMARHFEEVDPAFRAEFARRAEPALLDVGQAVIVRLPPNERREAARRARLRVLDGGKGAVGE